MLNNIARKALVSFSVLISLAGVASADTKVKTRQTSNGQTYENTSYIKGKRQRSEMQNGQMVMVQQCDLRRNIQIMPQPRVYMIQPYDVNTPSSTAKPGAPVPSTKGGVVTSTITTKDTGERKQMFGYTARHIITTMVMESSPEACSQTKTKMEFDGWYIDATFALDCEMSRNYQPYQSQSGGCRDRYETKQIGSAKKGYPVWEKTTMYDASGNPSFTTLNEVIELSQATLEQSLFEIPEGYREVQDFASVYSSAAGSQTASNTGSSRPNSGIASGVQSMANNSAAASTETGAKKEGIIRLGLATVKTGSVGEGLSARDLAAAVQNSLTEYLKDPHLEVVALEAKLPSAIDAEAKQKECDYIIYANVAHKKGGGGFGSMFGGGGGLSSIGSSVGYGGSQAAVVATQVASQAASAAMSENIKAKDEITLDVKLQVPGTTTNALAKQYKAKAKSAGEDILTPVIEQAAQAIVDTAKR